MFLAIRASVFLQGGVVLATGWSSYRSPGIALGTLAVLAVESAVVARLDLRAGEVLPRLALVDGLTGILALVAMALATTSVERTMAMNFVRSFDVGVAVGLAFSLPWVPGAAISIAIAGCYLATTFGDLTSGPAERAAALANAAAYIGLFVAVSIANGCIDRVARRLDSARLEASKQAELLTIERERVRSHRYLHDSALQTIEAIASGRLSGAAARLEAQLTSLRLRSDFDAGGGSALPLATTDLVSRITRLATDHETRWAARIQVVADARLPQPRPDTTAAVLGAVGEALNNVAKHAGVDSATLRAREHDGGLEVVVRDEGRGFDAAVVDPAFGLEHSVRRRIAEVGGVATVSSLPGAGTRVRLWVPLAGPVRSTTTFPDDQGPSPLSADHLR